MRFITSHHNGEYLPDSYTHIIEIDNKNDMLNAALKQFKKYLTYLFENDYIFLEGDCEWDIFMDDHKNRDDLKVLENDNNAYDEYNKLLNKIYKEFINYLCDAKILGLEKKIGDDDDFINWQIDENHTRIVVSANGELYGDNLHYFHEFILIE